jgi:UDP-glucose 4-epimerase
LPVDGDGEQSRDFTYVGTLVEAITEAIVGRVTSSPTNLAFGTRTTLNELIALIGAETALQLAVTHSEPRPGDVRHSQADNSLLRSLLPRVEPISLEAGLAETIAWMRQYIASSQ